MFGHHNMTYVQNVCIIGSLVDNVSCLQGRRRLSESGTAIEHRWYSPSADGTRGGGGTRGGFGGPLPRKFCNSR